MQWALLHVYVPADNHAYFNMYHTNKEMGATKTPTKPNNVISSLPSDSSGRHITEDDRSASIDAQQRKLMKKIKAEKKNLPAPSSWLFLQKLLESSVLLVGKNIKRLFVVDHNKLRIRGGVTDISSQKGEPLKIVYTINTENEDELNKTQHNLLSDLKRNNVTIHGEIK